MPISEWKPFDYTNVPMYHSYAVFIGNMGQDKKERNPNLIGMLVTLQSKVYKFTQSTWISCIGTFRANNKH